MRWAEAHFVQRLFIHDLKLVALKKILKSFFPKSYESIGYTVLFVKIFFNRTLMYKYIK